MVMRLPLSLQPMPCPVRHRLRRGGHRLPAEGWSFTPSALLGAHQASLAIFLPILDTSRLRVMFQGVCSLPHQFFPQCRLLLFLLFLTPRFPAHWLTGERLTGCLGSCVSCKAFSFPPRGSGSGEGRQEQEFTLRRSALCVHPVHALSTHGK